MASSTLEVRCCSKMTFWKDSMVTLLVTDVASLGAKVVRGINTNKGACGFVEEGVVAEVVG